MRSSLVEDPAAEESLVVAAKNGNEQAFEMLVERYRHRIVATALHFTRVQEDAEDVAQQSFHKAFVHLHTFEGKSAFSTWLTRIAVNEALMLLRRGRSLREVPIDDSNADEGTPSGMQIVDLSPDPESSYLRKEEAQILCKALGNLRPGMRKAFELRELAELSTEETAQCMGLSVGAVKARLFHGRKKLREALRRCMRVPRTLGNGGGAYGSVSDHRHSDGSRLFQLERPRRVHRNQSPKARKITAHSNFSVAPRGSSGL